MKRFPLLFILLALCSFAMTTAAAQPELPDVIATTTILADVARNVGGDRVNVTALIPPDADTHAWQPTPDDVLRVAQADIVLVVGAGYETFLGTLIENAAETEIVVVSNGIKMLPFGEHGHDDGEAHTEGEHANEEYIGILGEEGVCAEAQAQQESAQADHEEGEDHAHGACDPHVWTSPKNVMIWAANIAETLAAADAANAETYRANAAAYIAQLEALDAEIAKIVSVVPEERRVLVTNHEFLGYFAHEYGFEVIGVVIPGGTTLGEPDPQELAKLITIIEAERAPAIFAEVSANPGLAAAVAAETGIGLVTTLYSESLSAADGPAATYLDYMRYNAQTIADALKQPS